MAIPIKERVNDPVEMMLAAIEGVLRGTWTAMPAIVQDFDANKLTVTAQPAIQQQITKQDGTTQFKNMTVLKDVPVVFPRAGGFILTFPLAKDDEVLIVFASRAIDAWWQQGGIQPQSELRLHDLSDGFCIPGVGSLAKPISGGANTSTCQLRSIDGQVVIEITSDHKVNVTAPGNTTITGDLHVTGAVIAGYGGSDQVGLQTHTHDHSVPPDPGS